jgi:hypothetical protein
MADARQVWWQPEGRSPFDLELDQPRLPQILWAAVGAAVIFGSPLVLILMINYFPPLVANRTIYAAGLGGIAFWFLASFVCFGDESFPRDIPTAAKLIFRVGWALAMTGLVIGIGGIANGYGTDLVNREAAVVAKHQTRHRDPDWRTNYVAMRAWPGSRAIVELSVPREVYDRLNVPVTAIDTPPDVLERMPDRAAVRLTVGQGRFGPEWLARIQSN